MSDCSREEHSHDVAPVHLHSTHLPPPSDPPMSPPQPSSPTTSSSHTQWSSSNTSISPTSSPPPSFPTNHPSFKLTLPIQPRTFRPTNPPPSRLESSLLKYTPVQYSRLLESGSSSQNVLSSYSHGPEDRAVQSGRDDVDAGRPSNQPESTSSTSSSQPTPGRRQVYTPFMKLMEMTAQINIEWRQRWRSDRDRSFTPGWQLWKK